MKVGTTNKESYVCTVVYLVLHFHSLYLYQVLHSLYLSLDFVLVPL